MRKIGIQCYAKNQYGRIVEDRETCLCQYFRKAELSCQIFEALELVFDTFPFVGNQECSTETRSSVETAWLICSVSSFCSKVQIVEVKIPSL